MPNYIVYRCTEECTINKRCFILKTDKPLPCPILVYQKCTALRGNDIKIIIGDEKPP